MAVTGHAGRRASMNTEVHLESRILQLKENTDKGFNRGKLDAIKLIKVMSNKIKDTREK